MKEVKLSPSDFSFLYENCKRCFYLKTVNDIKKPSDPFPAIFGKLDKVMTERFTGKLLSDLSSELPDGKIVNSDMWVKSKFIEYPDLDYRQYILGKVQHLIKMEDGSYQVIAIKTSDTDRYDKLYMRQLHAYAYALEHPMNNMDAPLNISGIGLIIFDPVISFEVSGNGRSSLVGNLIYKPLIYSPTRFLGFLQKFADILSLNSAPDFNPECPYCQRDMKILELNQKNIINNDLIISFEEE